VKRHGGAITCRSVSDRGTTFEIFIPVVGAAPVVPVERIKTPFRAKGRALIMDDQKPVREVLGQMLDHLGLETAFAEDGAAAARLYREAFESGRGFDLVFMDLTVPSGMGGIESARLIAAFDPTARVVASTGYSNDPVMAEPSRYGFCDLLVKPFTLEAVVQIVAKLLPRPGG
jgi:CheY-like chemotaxis protein